MRSESLAYNGFVTGLYLDLNGREYFGAEAYDVLDSLYWESAAFAVSRVRGTS